MTHKPSTQDTDYIQNDDESNTGQESTTPSNNTRTAIDSITEAKSSLCCTTIHENTLHKMMT
ncbi:hypothetical protein E2C01_014088 [Portunus trituberculatus]|uniref:Uncharacterized protein n=1 Tax=Portunus trituberculatus TaxID=210409 RepID=A0A5B7DIY9_PORTR|nr:hypothetical protein [Portunus trituberculatus]